MCDEHIPKRTMLTNEYAHPWINDKVRIMVAAKHAAEGTDKYKEAVRKCSEAIRDEFSKYVARVRKQLLELPPSSKQYWRLSKQIMFRPTGKGVIPALRQDDKNWARSAEANAGCLARGEEQIPAWPFSAFASISTCFCNGDGRWSYPEATLQRAGYR